MVYGTHRKISGGGGGSGKKKYKYKTREEKAVETMGRKKFAEESMNNIMLTRIKQPMITYITGKAYTSKFDILAKHNTSLSEVHSQKHCILAEVKKTFGPIKCSGNKNTTQV